MTNSITPLSAPAIVDRDPHSHKSILREHIVEHLFIGAALKLLWQKGLTDVEVLRSEFDAYGYDLVMARGDVVRHIQLKTGTTNKPGDISVPLALASKRSGCVLWIGVSKENLDIRSYYWFGGAPGKRLPRIAQYEKPLRSTRNKASERPLRHNHRLVPKDDFLPLGDDLEAVLKKILGPLIKTGLSGD